MIGDSRFRYWMKILARDIMMHVVTGIMWWNVMLRDTKEKTKELVVLDNSFLESKSFHLWSLHPPGKICYFSSILWSSINKNLSSQIMLSSLLLRLNLLREISSPLYLNFNSSLTVQQWNSLINLSRSFLAISFILVG